MLPEREFKLSSNFFLILFSLAITFYACKKDTENPRENPEQVNHVWSRLYPSYMPCKVGNYWIYERYRFEQHGPSSSLNQFDSMYVEKDTTIRGHQFWIIKRFDFNYSHDKRTITRDSLHYIIDEKGTIQFSSQDFSTEFSRFYSKHTNDTLLVFTSKMNDKDLVVTTAAGTFSTSSFQQTILVYPKFVTVGVNNPRYMNCRYAKNIGIIQETELYFMHATFGTERRLIRYKVN
jgi:hypothetical protein